jgi:hypothetical protein
MQQQSTHQAQIHQSVDVIRHHASRVGDRIIGSITRESTNSIGNIDNRLDGLALDIRKTVANQNEQVLAALGGMRSRLDELMPALELIAPPQENLQSARHELLANFRRAYSGWVPSLDLFRDNVPLDLAVRNRVTAAESPLSEGQRRDIFEFAAHLAGAISHVLRERAATIGTLTSGFVEAENGAVSWSLAVFKDL